MRKITKLLSLVIGLLIGLNSCASTTTYSNTSTKISQKSVEKGNKFDLLKWDYDSSKPLLEEYCYLINLTDYKNSSVVSINGKTLGPSLSKLRIIILKPGKNNMTVNYFRAFANNYYSAKVDIEYDFEAGKYYYIKGGGNTYTKTVEYEIVDLYNASLEEIAAQARLVENEYKNVVSLSFDQRLADGSVYIDSKSFPAISVAEGMHNAIKRKLKIK